MKKILLGIMILTAVISVLVFANLTSAHDGWQEGHQPYKYLPLFPTSLVHFFSTFLMAIAICVGFVVASIFGISVLADGINDHSEKSAMKKLSIPNQK